MLRHIFILLIATFFAIIVHIGLIWRSAHYDNRVQAIRSRRTFRLDGTFSMPKWSASDGPAWFVRERTFRERREYIGIAAPARAVSSIAGDQLASLPGWSIFNTPPSEADLVPSRREIAESLYGWPFPSMRSVLIQDTAATTGSILGRRSTVVRDGIEYTIPAPGPATPNIRPAILPIGILWPGFLINTLLLLPVGWLIAMVLYQGGRWMHHTRQYARWRRKECPVCRYALADPSRGCAECGWGREDDEERARFASWGRRKRVRKRRRHAHFRRRPWPIRLISMITTAVISAFTTTLLVAWACAVFTNPNDTLLLPKYSRAVSHEDGVATIAYRWSAIGMDVFGQSVQFSRGANVSDQTPQEVTPRYISRLGVLPTRDELDDEEGSRFVNRQIIATGWPFRAFAAVYEHRNQGDARVEEPIRYGIPVPLAPWQTSSTRMARSLPYLPLPRGLTLSMLTYGGIWLIVLVTGGFALRRWRRWLRFCPTCRNDLRDHATPQCELCGWRDGRPG